MVTYLGKRLLAIVVIILCTSGRASSQTTSSPQPSTASQDPTVASGTVDDAGGKQPKRILWVIPNYRAVSADSKLPPLSSKEKFDLATKDSFDYSSFILAGILAGLNQSRHSSPEFGQGAAGYGRYYWHALADEVSGNYLTEALIPAAMHEDPRYYTLGHGSFFVRTRYAMTRLIVTKTDSGKQRFNFSEIAGNGIGAALSNAYYPAQERTWSNTSQKWLTQIGIDGIFNVFKEFWPDISSGLSRSH